MVTLEIINSMGGIVTIYKNFLTFQGPAQQAMRVRVFTMSHQETRARVSQIRNLYIVIAATARTRV